MELNTIEYTDFTKLGAVIWRKGYDSVENCMLDSGIVKKMSIASNTGNTREFSDIDSNEYISYKAQSDQAKRSKAEQGYTKTMTSYRIAENIGISYEMRTQNKYPEIVAALTNLGAKAPKTIDLDLSHRLTFGTAVSYVDRDGRTITTTCGDDLQLFYSAHTLNGSSTTFRNRLANNPKLSKGSLESMERLGVEETYNNLGEKMVAKYNILWITDNPNQINIARQHLLSTAAIDGVNSGVINPYKGAYTLVILPRVATTAAGAVNTDKRDYWGLVSSNLSTFYFGEWESTHMIAPSVGNGVDVQTDDWEYGVRAGYGITTVSPRGFLFSSGDAEA